MLRAVWPAEAGYAYLSKEYAKAVPDSAASFFLAQLIANSNRTRSERCSLIASHPVVTRLSCAHSNLPYFSLPDHIPYLAFAISNNSFHCLTSSPRNTLYSLYFCCPSSSSSTIYHLPATSYQLPVSHPPSPPGPHLRFHLVSPIVRRSCIRGGGVLKGI